MKKLFTFVIATAATTCHHILTNAQLIDSSCFQQEGNFVGNTSAGEEFSNLDELFDQNILKPDMKLYRVLVCVHQEKGHIQGVELVLRTIASEFVSYSKMKLLGNLDSPNCKPYLIPDADLVEYMEVTYSDYVDSIVMRISNDYYSFWGNKRRDVDYKTKRWNFEKNW